jgi:hypothetical protein
MTDVDVEQTAPAVIAEKNDHIPSTEEQRSSDSSVDMSADSAEEDGAIRVGTEATLTHVKTTKDGKITLLPQPSDDPRDPLNWNWGKKHLVLLSLFMPALLTDFGMTWGE